MLGDRHGRFCPRVGVGGRFGTAACAPGGRAPGVGARDRHRDVLAQRPRLAVDLCCVAIKAGGAKVRNDRPQRLGMRRIQRVVDPCTAQLADHLQHESRLALTQHVPLPGRCSTHGAHATRTPTTVGAQT